MKTFRNWICILHGPSRQQLYGNSRVSEQVTQRLTQNGLLPFPTMTDAIAALNYLVSKTSGQRVQIAHLEFALAESAQDLLLLHRQDGPYLVIQQNPWDPMHYELYGPRDPAYPSGIDTVSCIEESGLKPFLTYEATMEAYREVVRQSQTPASIARWILSKC